MLVSLVERQQGLLLDGLERRVGDAVPLVRVEVGVAHLRGLLVLLLLLELAYALGHRGLGLRARLMPVGEDPR